MASEYEEPLLPPSTTQSPPHTTITTTIATAKPLKTRAQKAIRKTFKGTTRLSSLLPSGSVLIFEMMSPVLTKKGQCKTLMDQALTTLLLLFCSATCFLMCFIDSVLDSRGGRVHYGIATFRGLWVIDGLVRLEPEESAKYRIRFIDFMHGVASVFVFVAVASLNQDVVKCLLPGVSEIQKAVAGLPVWVGTACSLLFVWFPNKRNGVANPVCRR